MNERLSRIRASEAFIVFVVGTAIFTDLFLYAILVPVLPYALPSRFGISEDRVQGRISEQLATYAAGLLVACPIAGYIADKTPSRRIPFLGGLVALLGATVLFTVARQYWLLILARVLQGVSAAVVWTVGMALLVDSVGKERIGVAMGTVSVFMGAAMVSAPLLGGVLYHVGGYYAPFYLSFALLVLDIVLRLLVIEKKKTSEESTVARRKTRIPPILRLLKLPRLLAGCWIGFCASTVLSAFDAVLPLHLEEIFNFNSLYSGLTFGAVVLPSFIVSPIAGWFIDTRGTKGVTLVGTFLLIPFLVLLRFPNSTSPRAGQIVLMCVLLALNGAAVAMIIPASLIEIAYIVEIEETRQPGLFGKRGAYAQAYALFNIAYSAGTLVGPLAAGAIRDASGWSTMCWTISLFLVASIPVIFYIVGGHYKNAHWIKRRPVVVTTDKT